MLLRCGKNQTPAKTEIVFWFHVSRISFHKTWKNCDHKAFGLSLLKVSPQLCCMAKVAGLLAMPGGYSESRLRYLIACSYKRKPMQAFFAEIAKVQDRMEEESWQPSALITKGKRFSFFHCFSSYYSTAWKNCIISLTLSAIFFSVFILLKNFNEP